MRHATFVIVGCLWGLHAGDLNDQGEYQELDNFTVQAYSMPEPDCEEPFEGDCSCDALVKELARLVTMYSIKHPDIRRACRDATSACRASNPDALSRVCELCDSCGSAPED